MSQDDTLALGARIASILATGRRESTYKLVTLLALIHYSEEYCPEDASDELHVDLRDLARRVAELYRPSLRPFMDRDRLIQVKGDPRNTMLDTVSRIDIAWHDSPSAGPLGTLARHLAQQPLTHLQNDSHVEGEDFLFNASWLHKKITNSELDAHDWRIRLRPGVAARLARLAPLLVPVIERLWVSEVLRFNPLLPELQVEDYLLGSDRRSMHALHLPLLDSQEGRCFYCSVRIEPSLAHVDHVVPWSRCGFDGLANLVLTDRACNLSKLDSLPSPEHIRRAVTRRDLDHVFAETRWAPGVQADRMLRTAAGQLRFVPDGYRLWRGRTESTVVTKENRGDLLGLLDLAR